MDPELIFCDLCGASETPADLTPDWNGETGCHRSCEAAVDASEAPVLLDFDLDWSRFTIGDVEVIEYALRTFLLNADPSPDLKASLISTLGKVEKVAKPKAVTA